jgi:hypothetical protein
MTAYNGQDIQFRHPDNWRLYGQGSAMTLAPDGGVINDSLAYGMLISLYESDDRRQEPLTLVEATDALIRSLQRSNPNMRVTRTRVSTRMGDREAYVTESSNLSPAGGTETDWIVTTLAPGGQLYYFVGVAPENDFDVYRPAFQQIVDSAQFR